MRISDLLLTSSSYVFASRSMETHNLPSPSSCPSTSASISYAHNNSYVYDVFINHRGPDCKKTLATDLYNRLRGYGLRVFLDQRELQEGDALDSQIKGAIERASVHLAIFSQNYAQSSWCLDELVLMFQSRATIIPVFYGSVKPSHLRWVKDKPEGPYARDLLELERKRGYQHEILEKWRQALSQAGGISGVELENYNGDQDQRIQQIEESVLKNVKRPVHVAKYPIGLDQKIEDFEKAVSLQPQSSETRVIGIVGPGGVGKTTLANEIFNRRQSKYDRACYLSDVSGKTVEFSQGKLLEGLARRFHEQIGDIKTGIDKIETYLASPLALLIVDNVDNINQLDALFVPLKDKLSPGSLVLITSRNKDVLINSGIEKSFIYELNGLHQQHSQELFCSHAFGQPNPREGFREVVKNFLYVCQGLPLSLQVIGASLYGKDEMEFWVAHFNKISNIVPDDITSRLRISYDGLDNEEKQMFLDIACFFLGEYSDTAIRIWGGSGWNGWLGLHKLQNRYLIEVDSENRIRMHDHLRDLGRDIGEKESPHRLWRGTEDLHLNLLDNNFQVRGIDMVHQHGSEWPDPHLFKTLAELPINVWLSNMGRLRLLRAEGDYVESIFSAVQSPQLLRFSPRLVWLSWDSCPCTSLPAWIPLEKLHVLEINGSNLHTLWPDEYDQAPLKLRELIIDAPLSKIPKSIGKLKDLEKLVLRQNERVEEANLKTFLDELCHLKSLKFLVLRKCSNMESLPDSFVNLTNLEHLDLSECSNLQKLPSSFGKLQNLELIDLSGCVRLKTFPPGRWKRKKPPRN